MVTKMLRVYAKTYSYILFALIAIGISPLFIIQLTFPTSPQHTHPVPFIMAQQKKESVKPENDDKMPDLDSMFNVYTERINLFEKNICEFPVDNNKIINNDWKNYRDRIYFHMQHTYPLVHGGILSLVYNFLLIKKKYGSLIEQKIYSNMTMIQFFHRLATKRAVVFYRPSDDYLLRNGMDGEGQWHLIGTDREKSISLTDYLSYDELIISAFCGISSPTHFINNGDRRNCGRIERMTWTDFYPLEAIYCGLVGARFEKQNVMENALMAIDKNQNIKQNGYGQYMNDDIDDDDDIDDIYDFDDIDDTKQQQQIPNDDNTEDEKGDNNKEIEEELDDNTLLEKAKISQEKNGKNNKMIWRAWERFYDREYLPTFDEINSKYKEDEMMQQRYLQREGWRNSDFLDIDMFKRRIRISMEIFLFDADQRAMQYKELYKDQLDPQKLRGAFCHVVGLGTGVWSFEKREQNRMIVSVTKDIIKETNLKHIDCIYFSWMTNDCMNIAADKNEAMFERMGDNQYIMNDKDEHSISILFGRRSPGDELEAPYRQCLIVAQYAWDSNSFPGNEYYHGMLSASGDPAAASCSTISFIQNAEINQEYINGKNTGIYFYDQEAGNYEFYKLKDIDFENNKKKWLKKSVLSIPYKRERLKVIKNEKK